MISETETVPRSTDDAAKRQIQLQVAGMSCASCVRRVERAAAAVPGVREASVNLASGRASIVADDAMAMPDLVSALGAAGYPVAEESVDLAISGMSCASCVRRVERSLARVPGVIMADVNLATERARVRIAAGTGTEPLRNAVAEAGYQVAVPEPMSTPGGRMQPQRLGDGWMAALACALAAPLLLPMLLLPAGIELMLPWWLQLALAGTVQLAFGWRFYRGAWHALRAMTGSMDTLVAIGTSAAFGLSLWEVASGRWDHGHLYFEASATVIALVRLGKWLEGRARRQAGEAIRALQRLRPETARVRRGEDEVNVPVAELRPGDLLPVRPGERFPADGIVRDGEGSADESLLTGELMPVAKFVGSSVVGGSLNGDAPLLIQATTVGIESRLDGIVRLVESAQAAKPPVQRLVDRVSAVFVPVVVGIAVLTALGWLLAGAEAEVAIVNAVAVLVIACPCALGLATPAAIMVGTGVAARHGILIRDPAALEQAGRIRTVVFDKTGTLTEGRPALVAIRPAQGVEQAELLRLAVAVQAGSEHPLAQAVRDAAPAERMQATGVRALPGQGVSGIVDGALVLLGTARLMGEHGVPLGGVSDDAAALAAEGRTLAFLARHGRVLGLLAFGDAIKPGASDAIAQLRRAGMRVVMLTGDNHGAAAATARQLGLDEVHAEAMPQEKAAIVEGLRGRGAVCMVGDGVNDAPALVVAELGMAMASGTDVASAAAGITLMRSDPALVPMALDISRRTHARIRQGLVWAFAYNVVGIPLAAAGLLSPVVAGAAMAFSSVGVVGSALLLRRWRPER